MTGVNAEAPAPELVTERKGIDPELGTPLGSSAATHRAAVAMATVGCGAVILGGLIAAATDPIDLYRGSWMAAYLVLVVGASQVVMGTARKVHGERKDSWAWTQFGCWNAGSAIVIAGTLSASPTSVSLGSVLLLVALGIAINAARGLPMGSPFRLRMLAYRAVLGILALSIPVGILLSFLRHS